MNTIFGRDYVHSKLNEQLSITDSKKGDLNHINSSSEFRCSDIHDIGPEDLKWSGDMLQDVNNEEKSVFNKFFVTENDQKSRNSRISFSSDILNYKSMEIKNSVCVPIENYNLEMEGSLCNFPHKSDYKDLQTLGNCSENTLKRLYQNEQNTQSDGHKNFAYLGKEHEEHSSIDHNIQYDIPCDTLKSNFHAKVDYGNQEKSVLHTETISLIKDGIAGTFSSEDSLFPCNEIPNENEQIVPVNDQMLPKQSENPGIFFNSAGQNEIKTHNDCGEAYFLGNIKDSNQLNSSTFISHELLTSNEQRLGNELSCNKRFLKNKNLSSKKKKILTDNNFRSFQELFAFTPGGQIYKLIKESSKQHKTKGKVDNIFYLAAEINHLKKIIQIQSGKFIPGGLDVNKEENSNFKAIQEQLKAKNLFTTFNIDLNVKYLTVEYELLKLDRKIKQYLNFNPQFVLEALELIEEIDVELINLIYVPQVYETILKVTKICNEGSLGVKSRAVLKKFQSLISPPQGKEAKEYLDELCSQQESILKSGPTKPIEWILHLMVLE